MKQPKIIWVTPENVSEKELKKAAALPIDGIQLRAKTLTPKQLLEIAQFARIITLIEGKKLTINSSYAAVDAVQADGIHLPEAMMDFEKQNYPINISVHSLEAAKKAETQGADAITFGPIFSTPSKQIYGTPQGLKKLEEVIKAVSIPVYAIGGITLENQKSVIECGAYGIMMQRFINKRILCQ